ncbi:hypothetical protein [Schleiferilactobacillus shenzhenensis]|uniref:Membrane protein 6-pyruvoyl-tetrahydropterin synthase-related domain-containing protein n=1 Tax=Schleiferilactobacillus shenzhenensis LY-73 TaxID=1231336 RepID=U4TRN7_9LACO|nr:hypothetical protein [Schleiferilactobacillus shenzhenensis]ERL64568.1 hypothetical protein L248_0863 [Schleiferilactobacillus shenzhenensis LY-73]
MENTNHQSAIRKALPWAAIVIIPALLAVANYVFWASLHQSMWKTDTWFHLMRLFDLQQTTSAGQVPALVNANSFLNIGQAFNGMYPTYSLWPLVALFHGLGAMHQWLAVQSAILYLASSLTAVYLFLLTRHTSFSLIMSIASVWTPAWLDYTMNGSLGMMWGTAMLPAVLVACYLVLTDTHYAPIIHEGGENG